ncbi:histidine kinase N-terminal 7TM domain-containing protein [Natronomonas gomsonensis]|uniref:sensor histidine kinase n=1 Tax=Natronomonas gomsonensis TaxID=1046043 RepID=UPI0015B9A44C|nr:histidine kinase N-terminal 7TM domain-containing protein [Natronomonas gomsonensis]
MPLATPVSLPFLIGYVAAMVVAGGLSGYCLYRRSGRVSRAFGLTMVAVFSWSVGALGRTAVSTEAAWYALTLVMYAGVVGSTALFFVFTVRYTGSKPRVTGRQLAGLFVVPALSLLLLATNPVHGLFFAGVERSTMAGTVVFETTAGPWFWVHSLYSYALLGGGTLLLVRFAAGNRSHYRRQALPLLFGVALPWGTNVAYVFGPVGGFPVDPTPVGFALGGVFIAYAVFRARLTDLTPIARSSVVDAIDDAVFVLDDRRRLVDFNTAAASLLDADDPVGEEISDLLPAALSDADGDATPLDTSGTERWYRSREVPIEGIGSVLLVSDVTERMRRRRQLREQNERLEEFTRVAAHDLRNPLNAITGYTELARETGEVSYLEQVDPATDRMETLVDDLLTLGEEGQVVEETEPVPVAEVAERAWANVETDDATLQAVDDGWILADETRLTNLLEKLFRNCVEHAPGDDDSVTVRIGMLSDGFFVADDGIGIPTDARADVFDYGYSTHGGTGLGLPVVRSIAVAHGWEVSVTDSDTGGARFEFRSVQLHAGPQRERPDVDTPWGRTK